MLQLLLLLFDNTGPMQHTTGNDVAVVPAARDIFSHASAPPYRYVRRHTGRTEVLAGNARTVDPTGTGSHLYRTGTGHRHIGTKTGTR